MPNTLFATRLFFLALTILASAKAEPSFARKYKADCSLCHTVYPRLNRTGYEFRRLGYRFPREVEERLTHQPATPAQLIAPASSAQEVTAGTQIYDRLHCASCHSIDGQGGAVGPALDGISARRSAGYISAQIQHPRDHNASSIMPSFALSDQETSEITAYLLSLSSKQQEATRKFNPLDDLGISWIPALRGDQSGSSSTDLTDDTRTMILFLAGTLGDHASMFVESNPAATAPGFGNKFDEAQGVLNFGDAEDFTRLRGGQILTLQGDGFGATDRFFSDSLPLIYGQVNGFAAARYGVGGSGEYTIGMSTTFKVFGVDDTDSSRVFGGVWEQLIGKQGLSGVSVEFAEGWNPNRTSPLGRDFHFQRWYFGGNKTFQNRTGRQILNLMGGLAVANDNQFLGGGPPNQVSHGYGSFVELDTFPVFRHVTTYVRFDQLRPSTQSSASQKAGTAGIVFDVSRYWRLLLEYQRFTAGVASNFFTIGFRVNL